ncbi:MAG: hypothetical protein CM1200mP2_14010 [Planctomycetaceae bacterium]|nr:MAG: hypothetical protein CM1200mP2_14010 [Planctomycetaceae bacterium]
MALLTSLATGASGDVITLKSGQKIEAPVLKETDTAVFLDVGVDVLRVPNREDRLAGKECRQGGWAKARITKNRVYATGRMPTKPIKELARDFGAAVVLVQTPAGWGRGSSSMNVGCA